jgi:uncharacterized protein with FMN-binding domain
VGDEEEKLIRGIPIILVPFVLSISPGFHQSGAVAETKTQTGAVSQTRVASDTVALSARACVSVGVAEAMSVRRSVRKFQDLPVSSEKLSWLLWAAGSAWPGAEPPGRILVVQKDRTGRYDPAHHVLVAQPDSISRIYGSEAPLTLTLAPRAGESESDSLWVWRGAAGQAIYLGAAAMELGTVTRGGVRFPVGLPGDSIRRPPFKPVGGKFDTDDSGGVSLESAMVKAAARISPPDPAALLGKIVWAMYGRSSAAFSDGRRHRTVASARNRYPMTVYVLSNQGVSLYDPEADRLVPVQNADPRDRFAEAAGFPALRNGPFGFLVAWDRAKMDNRGCALYEAGSMLFNARLVLNPLGIDARWHIVSDPAVTQRLIPGIQGEPFFLIAAGIDGTNPKKTSGLLKDGKYKAESPGWTGMAVEVRVTDRKIRQIQVLRAKGSERFYKQVVQDMPSRIIAKGSLEIDGVTGATLSSTALKVAVRMALEKAKHNDT